ncbi:hypothetical protein [Clostridium sp. Marseille-P3244]|uniref:hypothetical protein n=1 Tax=Clostridium sp. Marseille-P3244 TaxID=1871020 RepID=UPI000931815D|nr:hypothetical protein [Clostridium sp. Marseille-P3244]
MEKKGIKKIILASFLLISFIIAIVIFLPQYREYKKYVHFKDENLENIVQVATSWSESFDLWDEDITIEQANEVERIYIKALRLKWDAIKTYEDLLNFPNAEYVQLGVTEGYESGDSAGREEYLQLRQAVENPPYAEKLKPVLAELEKLRWVRIYSDIVLEDLDIISECEDFERIHVYQNQLKNLDGIEGIKIQFADFSENDITDIWAAGSAEIQFLVLTDNNIEDYSPLLEIEGLKAVSFDFDKGNGKEIAEKLTEKGCIASNDKWVPYRMFWEILEQSES